MLGSYTSITHRWFFCRCNCGGCSSENLQNPNEFLCCVEIEECVECLSSEMVIEEVDTNPKCVTQHPGFGQVCLQKWSLRLAADKYKTKNKMPLRILKRLKEFEIKDKNDYFRSFLFGCTNKSKSSPKHLTDLTSRSRRHFALSLTTGFLVTASA